MRRKTTMTLSEAIRTGAALHAQGYEDYLTNWHSPTGQDGWLDADAACTCVLGAAFEGATGLLPFDDPFAVYDQEKDARAAALAEALEGVADPDGTVVEAAVEILCGVPRYRTLVLPDGTTDEMFPALARLNDAERWTREQIADYIARQGF